MIASMLAGALVALAALGQSTPSPNPAHPTASATDSPVVTITRLPRGCLQPSVAVGPDGTLHVVCLTGKPEGADVQYLRRAVGKSEFEKPAVVNSIPGSAVAIG